MPLMHRTPRQRKRLVTHRYLECDPTYEPCVRKPEDPGLISDGVCDRILNREFLNEFILMQKYALFSLVVVSGISYEYRNMNYITEEEWKLNYNKGDGRILRKCIYQQFTSR